MATLVNQTFAFSVEDDVHHAVTVPATTKGNLLVFLAMNFEDDSGTGSIVSVVGNAGTVFQQASGSFAEVNDDGRSWTDVWYATAVGDDTSVTVTTSDDQQNVDIFILEYQPAAGKTLQFSKATGVAAEPDADFFVTGPTINVTGPGTSNVIIVGAGAATDAYDDTVENGGVTFRYLGQFFPGAPSSIDSEGPADLLNVVAGSYQPKFIGEQNAPTIGNCSISVAAFIESDTVSGAGLPGRFQRRVVLNRVLPKARRDD